jgi:phenylalanyl-tRNA synthetase beta chain
VFELDLERLFAEARDDVRFVDVVSFPPVREDLAFAVAEDVPAGDLAAAMREAAGPELREVRPFDVYHGPQVGDGRKSIAFSLVFQSPERTLADEDAQRLRGRIVEELARRFGAELRA